MLVRLFCKLAAPKVTLAVISLFTSYSALSFPPSFPLFKLFMPLASSFKKPQAACLINDDAYRRPQCSSLAWSSVSGGAYSI